MGSRCLGCDKDVPLGSLAPQGGYLCAPCTAAARQGGRGTLHERCAYWQAYLSLAPPLSDQDGKDLFAFVQGLLEDFDNVKARTA